MTDPFTVRDLRISETFTTARGGQILPVTVATFFVGDDGPFTVRLPTAEASSSRLQQLIDEKVRMVREVKAGGFAT